jgi:hypothetical protein
MRSLRRRATLVIACALVLVALAACAAPETQALLNEPQHLPERTELVAVPFFSQEDNYCGPAALATTLAWSGLPVTQQDIGEQVYTRGREGSLPSDLVTAARRHGRLAVPVEGLRGVLEEIAGGNPVIVFQNLSLDFYPLWHFAVAVGYDLNDGTIILRSGTEARRVTPLATFERTWERADYWALVVLPPDRLPVAASEQQVLRAAAGLERIDRFDEAAKAYAVISKRWPESLGAFIGLGNARYALGDLDAAESAFRFASARHPSSPAAWNNLAYVLARQGKKEEAIAAASEAVRLSKQDEKSIYLKTLDEVAAQGEPLLNTNASIADR